MSRKEIPDSVIETVARHINTRSNKPYGIPTVGNTDNIETPQIFEIVPFDQIDNTNCRFYAIDGSYNSEQFYNGLAVAMYAAGYICYHNGKQVRLNTIDDPVILGQEYYPENIIVTNRDHHLAIYDEVLTLKPVERLLKFWGTKPEDVFAYIETRYVLIYQRFCRFVRKFLR
jgi:hypothetical protein